MATDLTEGQVSKVIVTFSLPLLLSTVLQQFYNLADSMIVGNFTGQVGLASVGAAYPITLFFVAVATGASMGCSVVISQLFGARQMERLWQAVATSLVSFAVLGLALAGLGCALSGSLMRLLNAQEAIFASARAYLIIYALGVFPMLIYNACTGIFTGLGDAKLPLLLLFISSVLNVVLDYVAVRFLQWGVAGAAWATTFSQLVAAVLSLYFLLRRMRAKLPVEPGQARFSSQLLRQIAVASVPCILQQGSVALGHSIMQSILNTYDTAIIAGYEAASKLHNFAYMGLNTVGSAFATFTAQCCGAKKYGRVKEGFRVCLLICLVCTACIIALFQLLPRQLVGLFIDGDVAPLVIEAGVNYLRIISPVYTVICFIIATGGLLRGTGRSVAFFVETIAEFAVRITMCFVLTRALNSYTGLYWAWYFGSPTGFLLCLGLAVHTFRTRLNQERAHT
jgi:putative MATE family efflux protein